MPILNEKQYLFLQSKLEAIPLKSNPLKEELLDHLCSDIEFRMERGSSFSQATQSTFDTFNEDEMQDIDKQTILLLNQKHVIMKKVSIAFLGLVLLISLVFMMRQEPVISKPLVEEQVQLPNLTFVSEKEPPTMSPLKGDYKVASGFGQRMHPVTKILKLHKGVDFIAPLGTPVYATSDGVIEKAVNQNTGKGNHIIIRHDQHYQTAYNHLSKIMVEAGQKVKKGDLIGEVGSTGASTGPHLHYEVIKSGEWVDPEPYLKP